MRAGWFLFDVVSEDAQMSLLQRHGHGLYSWYQCFESCCQRSLPGNEATACTQWPCKLSLLRKPWLANTVHQAGFLLLPQAVYNAILGRTTPTCAGNVHAWQLALLCLVTFLTVYPCLFMQLLSAPGGIQELCAHACLKKEHTGERRACTVLVQSE